MKLWPGLIAAALMVIPTAAFADAVCRGPVNSVTVSDGGGVAVDWGFGGITICYIHADYTYPNSSTVISKDTCRVYYDQAQSALAAGKDFAGYYVGISTCSSLQSNSFSIVPAAQYYMFR